MIRNRLSIRSGGRLPWGFSQVAAAGTRRMRRQRDRDRLEPAVLGVRPARLERHREGLAGRVHDRVRDLVRARVQPVEDLDAHRRARLLAGVAPGGQRGLHGRQQGVDVRDGVADAELQPVGGPLLARPRRGGGLLEREPLAAVGLEGGRAGLGRFGRILARVLGKRRPEPVVRGGRDRGLEPFPVALDEVGCHASDGTPSRERSRALRQAEAAALLEHDLEVLGDPGREAGLADREVVVPHPDEALVEAHRPDLVEAREERGPPGLERPDVARGDVVDPAHKEAGPVEGRLDRRQRRQHPAREDVGLDPVRAAQLGVVRRRRGT